MKYIESISFLETPEYLQDQIAREIVDDFDAGYNPIDYKDMKIEIYEYDPNDSKDRETLEDHYKDKVSNEGKPAESDLKYYFDNPNELIKFPILIFNGTCAEGRHRLHVSLKLNHKIRLYVV
jgi:hypothetical protein